MDYMAAKFNAMKGSGVERARVQTLLLIVCIWVSVVVYTGSFNGSEEGPERIEGVGMKGGEQFNV